MAVKRYGAANFSDLGGPTNPGRVWSPAYIFFKQAVDRQDTPENVLDALLQWLRGYRKVTDNDLNKIIQQGPGRAVSDIIKLIGVGMSDQHLPDDALETIRKAVFLLARRHITARQSELDKERTAVDKLSGEFTEEAKRVVDFLMEDNGSMKICAACEREFGVKFPNASHGSCKRHSLALLRQTKASDPKFDYAGSSARLHAMPEENFPPDLSRPENQALLAKGEKKDWEGENAKQQAYLAQWRKDHGLAPI